MQTGQPEIRQQLADAAAQAAPPRFTAADISAGVRRRRTRAVAVLSVAAAAVAAAVVVPLALGGSAAPGPSAGGRPSVSSVSMGPAVPVPEPTWTVTVNRLDDGLPTELADTYWSRTQYDVAPGEKLTIGVTITVPAHPKLTKLYLGINAGGTGIGPGGPIGMKPVLLTTGYLSPGPHEYTLQWTVPRGSSPAHGYQLNWVTYWSKSAKTEPQAQGDTLLVLDAKPGTPVPVSAMSRLRTAARQAASDARETKPWWIVCGSSTTGVTTGRDDPGNKGMGLLAPVYLCLEKGSFKATGSQITGNPAQRFSYLVTIFDVKTFTVVESVVSDQPPAVSLRGVGPLSSLDGGVPLSG